MGRWYRSPVASGMVFRYEGKGSAGYVFLRFKGDSPVDAVGSPTKIEIWNLEALEPIKVI